MRKWGATNASRLLENGLDSAYYFSSAFEATIGGYVIIIKPSNFQINHGPKDDFEFFRKVIR